MFAKFFKIMTKAVEVLTKVLQVALVVVEIVRHFDAAARAQA